MALLSVGNTYLFYRNINIADFLLLTAIMKQPNNGV